MRKIETKEQKEKKTKRNQLIIGIVLVGLMLLSTGGYAIMNNDSGAKSSSDINYDGTKFYKEGDSWAFSYNGASFITINNPNDVEKIRVNISKVISDYSNKPIYFVTESGRIDEELGRNLYSVAQRELGACIDPNCGKDLPIKECSKDNIFIIRKPLNNESEMIYQQENCIFIVAENDNQTKFVDAVLFKLIRI